MIKMYKKTDCLMTKVSVYGGYDIKDELKSLGFRWDGSAWYLLSSYRYDLVPVDGITEDQWADELYPKDSTCKWNFKETFESEEEADKKFEDYKKVFALLEKYLQK